MSEFGLCWPRISLASLKSCYSARRVSTMRSWRVRLICTRASVGTLLSRAQEEFRKDYIKKYGE